jgi:hypothetical protein
VAISPPSHRNPYCSNARAFFCNQQVNGSSPLAGSILKGFLGMIWGFWNVWFAFGGNGGNFWAWQDGRILSL